MTNLPPSDSAAHAPEPAAGDRPAPAPLTPQQAHQILPILDHAICAGMGELRAAIDVAFYEADATYYRGLQAAYALLHARLQVAARHSKELLDSPPPSTGSPPPAARSPSNPPL